MKHFVQRFASVAAMLASAVAAVAAPTPTFPGPAFPVFKGAADLTQRCQAGLTQAKARQRQMERHKPDALWLASADRFYGWMDDTSGPLVFVSNVHPDKAVRDASEACEQRWQQFNSSLFQSEALYKAAKQAKATDAIDRQALQDLVDAFEDSGVGLPPTERAKAKQLQDRINLLGQQFGKNVRDDVDRTWVEFTEAEMAGVPEGVWKQAPRTAQGKVRLKLDYPSYVPVMEQALSGAARERMWRAKNNEGGEANLKVLAEIVQLRNEYAGLFGHKSYADFVLRRRMARSVDKVQRFLGDVKAAVTEREKRDLDEFRAAKAMHLSQPLESTTLNRWDVAFYTERIRRERYSVDEEAFRSYFPPQQSLQFVMRLAEQMFGIKYTRVQAGAWHAEAQAYEVSDAKTGKPLAGLIVDLYPREGKYGHAAVWPLRGGATLSKRLPQAVLVVNFDRKGLTLSELETLLHEFGHALHTNLSSTRYSINAGTSVKHDFVEAPSQMLEDWVLDPRVLAQFKQVCPECKPVPDDLVTQARKARDFAKGVQTARQHLYASFDLTMYSGQKDDPLTLWQRMEGATPLGYVPGTIFPAAFSHVAQNYGAGYYGYLWSLVVAMDLRTAFEADRLDPAAGARYRSVVLSQGSQQAPDVLVRNFLGREFNSKAFYDDLAR
ncbi:MAG: Zn-dependent oligopeptidase [Vitreoscilla sp.]|nr:Zn-dependent oligopeptidase [Vitreoscilla sp.]